MLVVKLYKIGVSQIHEHMLVVLYQPNFNQSFGKSPCFWNSRTAFSTALKTRMTRGACHAIGWITLAQNGSTQNWSHWLQSQPHMLHVWYTISKNKCQQFGLPEDKNCDRRPPSFFDPNPCRFMCVCIYIYTYVETWYINHGPRVNGYPSPLIVIAWAGTSLCTVGATWKPPFGSKQLSGFQL